MSTDLINRVLSALSRGEVPKDAGGQTLDNITFEVIQLSAGETDDLVKKFAEGLARVPNFNCKLHLANCSLSDQGALWLSRALRSAHGIEELFLSQNKITHLGAIHIAESISQNTNLRVLDLLNNPIEDEGVLRLAEAICVNRTLETFKIGPLTDAGVAHLCYMLKVNRTVTSLAIDVGGCESGAAEALTLVADALRSQQTLQHIQVTGHESPDRVAELTYLTNKNRLKALRTSGPNNSTSGGANLLDVPVRRYLDNTVYAALNQAMYALQQKMSVDSSLSLKEQLMYLSDFLLQKQEST